MALSDVRRVPWQFNCHLTFILSVVLVWLTRSFRIHFLPGTRWKSTCVFLKNCTIDRSWSVPGHVLMGDFLLFVLNLTRICYVRFRLRDSPLNWESANTRINRGGNWREQWRRKLSPFFFLFPAAPAFPGLFSFASFPLSESLEKATFKALEDVSSPSLQARVGLRYKSDEEVFVVSLN